jgi:hypothetical protein
LRGPEDETVFSLRRWGSWPRPWSSAPSLTAAVSLSGGFDRAAEQADLPDLIVRFDDRSREDVDARLGALPNLETRAYRTEIGRIRLSAGTGSSDRARSRSSSRAGAATRSPRAATPRAPARRSSRRASPRRGTSGSATSSSPATASRSDRRHRAVARQRRLPARGGPAHLRRRARRAARGRRARGQPRAGWLRDPAREDETLTQARAVSYGLQDLRFVTRAGVQVLVGQAAGIVIALLVAFSVVALATAGIMLGASARSEVARRLPSIGVQRAVGFTRGRVVAAQARSAALVAAPAAAIGLAVGALLIRGPSDRLLSALNQVGPGADLLWWLLGAWLATSASWPPRRPWPAWRATAAPVASLLRGRRASGRAPAAPVAAGPTAGGGFGALGARLATARRARWATTVAVLGVASATLVLLLALASLLTGLRDDPGTVGRDYALTANLPASAAPDVRRLDGVEDAAPRWAIDASGAYALGQPLRLVAFPQGAEGFEAPPLAEGRRRRGPGEAEVGSGLADALGLRPGSTLAVALPTGGEARFRVSGVVRALENEGRTAYVPSERLDDLGALGDPQIAVRLENGADRAAVGRGLLALGARPNEATAATTRNETFLSVLATLLRVVALTVALVCLVVLAQALVLTVRERRPTIALLRTAGAGRGALARVLAGACAAVLVPAAVLGVALEWFVLGPIVASLAAGYAGLSLTPQAGHLLLAACGLAALGAVAVAWVGARVTREPVVAGLREEA